MKRWMAVTVLALATLGAMPAGAMEREGSIPEDLAARKPPRPNDLYVAVLPFWSADGKQGEVARACVMLNLMRHGFKLAPKGSPSLAAAARRTDAAIRRDPKWEPLARLETADAARVGKSLGAQWVIFGEFGDLKTQSQKSGGILPRKIGVIDIRLLVADTASGETIYWNRIRDTASGSTGLFRAKATAIERRLVTRAVNTIFDDIGTAMPDHYTGAEVSQEMVRQVVEAMGK